MSRARGAAAAGLAAAILVTLSGCTVDTTPDDGPTTPTPTPSTSTSEGGGESSDEPTTPDGPSPEDISAEILDAAAAQAAGAPIAAATGTVQPFAGDPALMTIEVLELRATPDGTFLSLRLSAEVDGFQAGSKAASTTKDQPDRFIRDLLLDDPRVTGQRYRPYQFDTERNAACLCPYLPLTLGTDPQVVTALFPPLPPEVPTVDVRWGSSDLVVANVPLG